MVFPKEVYCYAEKPGAGEEEFLMVSTDIEGLACENSKVPCAIYALVGTGQVVTTRTVRLARKTGGRARNVNQQTKCGAKPKS